MSDALVPQSLSPELVDARHTLADASYWRAMKRPRRPWVDRKFSGRSRKRRALGVTTSADAEIWALVRPRVGSFSMKGRHVASSGAAGFVPGVV